MYLQVPAPGLGLELSADAWTTNQGRLGAAKRPFAITGAARLALDLADSRDLAQSLYDCLLLSRSNIKKTLNVAVNDYSAISYGILEACGVLCKATTWHVL